MREKLYDKHGREIMRGDIVKVFHFVGARRKKHYMFKQCLGLDDKGVVVWFSHLRLNDEKYPEIAGRWLPDYEIIQSMDCKFGERPRVAVGVSN